jgi:enoyl-CoA hydratase
LKRAIYFGAARLLSPGLDQERAGFLSVGTTAAAARVARALFEDLDRLGDTPYLANPKPWLNGSRVDQTSC